MKEYEEALIPSSSGQSFKRGKVHVKKRLSVPKRATMAALAAQLRGLKKEMAALRRLMPPAPYLDLEWRR